MAGRQVAGVTTVDSVTEEMVEEANQSETGISVGNLERVDRIEEPGGYAVLYDTRTGEPSTVRLWEGDKTLRKYLEKRDPETNARVFSVRKPNIKRMQATVPCWMNRLSDKFDEFLSIGQIVGNGCTKMLFTEEDVPDHMDIAHPDQYAAYQRKQTNVDRARQNARDELLTDALIKLAQTKE